MSEESAGSGNGKVLAPARIHFSKPRQNPGLYIGIAALILALLFTGYLLFINNRSANICNTKDNRYLLSNAAQNLYNPAALQPTANQIKGLSGYQKDPNCLYVVVNYYVDANDATSAQTYLNELNKVYNPKKGLSNIFGGAKTVQQLQNDIAALNRQQQFFLHNQKLYTVPIQPNKP